jgi:hypothetical protein
MYPLMLFLKTTVRNNVSVLDYIVHYLLHVSAPIGGHLQIKLHKIYIKVTTVYVSCIKASAIFIQLTQRIR